MKSTKNPISIQLDLFLDKTGSQKVPEQTQPEEKVEAKIIPITKIGEKKLAEIYTRILNRTMS